MRNRRLKPFRARRSSRSAPFESSASAGVVVVEITEAPPEPERFITVTVTPLEHEPEPERYVVVETQDVSRPERFVTIESTTVERAPLLAEDYAIPLTPEEFARLGKDYRRG